MSRLVALVAACAISGLPAWVAAQQSRDGWVVLPLDDYKALRAKAFPAPPETPAPAVDATLTRVDYDLRLDGEAAVGEARLVIDVFREGWVEVPLPAGLKIQSAHLASRPLSLVESRSGKGRAARALLSKTGRASITLALALPVTVSPGSESLSLPGSAAAATGLTLLLPRQGIDVSVSGGLVTERTEEQGRTRVTVHVTPGSSLNVAWRRKREEPRAALPTRLRGTLTQIVGLGEEGIQTSVMASVEIVQGRSPAVRLAVPDGFIVNQVNGATVADWEVRPGALRVLFLEPLEASASFVVTGEIRAPREGRIEIPILRLADAEREAGGVAVEVVGAGEIRGHDLRGLTRTEAVDLGEAVAGRDSPSLVAFRFRPGDGQVQRALSVDVARYTPQAVLMANVEEARYEVLVTEEGKTLVRAHYAVRNNLRSFLSLDLPEGATLWSAVVGRRPLRPGKAEDGALLLPLEKGRAGEEAPAFLVEVTYVQTGSPWPDKGQVRLAFPALDLGISRSGVVLHYPPRFRVKPLPGPFREEPFEAPTSTAFHAPSVSRPVPPAPVAKQAAPIAPAQQQAAEVEQLTEEMQGLVAQFNSGVGRGARLVRLLPVRPTFPAFGPTVFLLSELTPEKATPTLDLKIKRKRRW